MEEFYPTLLTISSTVIGVLIAALTFFLVRIISDVKMNTENIGKNKGKIELVQQKQESDVEKIEKMTQLEIKALSREVNTLSSSVNTLVGILTEKSTNN